ncbi:acyltransferase [Streptomyces oceani]|uniref:acyltransferase n=1 Tax=Streptomyces oceani TaxID=1075402 RepID=UPI00147F6F05|nr:acyltransferase [Streptomyces oceani]
MRSGVSGERIRLSALDTITGGLYTDRAFYFRETLDGSTLRASLAEVLRLFPLLTGRQQRDPTGALSVLCNDAGATFEEVDSSLPIAAYAPDRADRPTLPQLLPQVAQFRLTGENVPLLAIRLTQAAGGGSVLGVRIKHTLVDGRSFMTFVDSWSREHLGRGYPKPNHDRHVLDELGSDAPDAATRSSDRFVVPYRRERFGVLAKAAMVARKTQTVLVRLPSAEVREIKRSAIADLPGIDRWVSTADAVSAHLWQVLSRLRARPDGARETLGTITNFQSALGQLLPPHYWGNTITNLSPVLTADELRGHALGEVAHLVRRTRSDVTAEKIRDETAFLLAQRAAGRQNRVMPRMLFGAFEGTVQLNDMSKMPHYALDFGGGTPFWCDMPSGGLPWMVRVMSAPEEDGSLDVHVSMPPAAAAAFQGQRSWQEHLHRYAP